VSLLLGATLMAPTGCQPPAPEPRLSTVVDEEFDPCAEQLHDLCGSLLLYYAAHRELPPRLADLGKGAPLKCPLSHRPYAYDPDSPVVAGPSGKVIVYDDAPVHPMKTRWGILVEPPAPGKPLTSRVVHLSENAFLALPPPPASQPQ